jgi:aminoglycoside 6'-N-acetyltransferase
MRALRMSFAGDVVRDLRVAMTCEDMRVSSGFHRGGFDNAVQVRGERTVLRPVELGDVELLVDWHDDDEVARYWDEERFTRETMLERLAREDVTPFIVEVGGEPIGYLQVHPSGLDMFLAPSARGRGLGPDAARAMARHLIEERGWSRVTVDPYCWNEVAIMAWRKAGFVDVSTHGADDEHTAPWVLMELVPYPVRS